MVTGGGSGGHITPILAVAAEIKKRDPKNTIIYIGQKSDDLVKFINSDDNINQSFSIFAGKFRRYHGEGLFQLLDIKTVLKNCRDFIYFIIGIIQSYFIIQKVKPDILFSRGGYVSVPVALAARLKKVPYITHDSDSTPSLANKLISKKAKFNAVALDAKIYPYIQSKTIVTGIPVSSNFSRVDFNLKQKYLKELNLNSDNKVLLIIGGGLGAVNINLIFLKIVKELLEQEPKLVIIHLVGGNNETVMSVKYDDTSILSVKLRSRVRVFGFIKDVYKYSGVADVIVSRAGATNIAEFAIQGKACIIIPSPSLANGHQLKNANYLSDHQAAIVLQENELKSDPHLLFNSIIKLLHDDKLKEKLISNILKEAQPDATKKLVNLILQDKHV